MRQRIDAERRVKKQHRTPDKADHQPRPSRDPKTEKPEDHRWDLLEPVQPPQFGKGRKIRHLDQIGRIVLPEKNPADMASRTRLSATIGRVVLKPK